MQNKLQRRDDEISLYAQSRLFWYWRKRHDRFECPEGYMAHSIGFRFAEDSF